MWTRGSLEPERSPALSPRESCRQPGERFGLHQSRRDSSSTSCVLAEPSPHKGPAPRETLNLFLTQEAAERTPQRSTAQAIAVAVLRPRTRPESGPSRGTPSIEASRHDATPVPYDRHMQNIARVYPRVLPPESNSPLPQFLSVRRPSCSGYVDRGAWAIPRSRVTGCERVS